jgi:hypothetical protein
MSETKTMKRWRRSVRGGLRPMLPLLEASGPYDAGPALHFTPANPIHPPGRGVEGTGTPTFFFFLRQPAKLFYSSKASITGIVTE